MVQSTLNQLQPIQNRLMQIEAEMAVPAATMQLVHFYFDQPLDNRVSHHDAYRFDLCLTPRPVNARACFPQRWGAHRFEPIGKVFFVPPDEAMIARSDQPGEQSSLICELSPQMAESWLGTKIQLTERHLQASLDIRDQHIVTLMVRLAEELRRPGFATEMMVELISAQLTIELARYWQGLEEEPSSGGLAGWRLRLIEERLREGSEPPSLAELSELCRLSVRQLTRGFRSSRGCSIGDYVAGHRIEQAKQLLATDQSVKAIALTLGFASPSSFCYAFRKATGETPGQYRLRQQALH